MVSTAPMKRMQIELVVGPTRLSGIEASPESPRGIVVALHGGGYSAGYWDHPRHSLLKLAAASGYRAVAIDRPGYGASSDLVLPLSDQVDVVLDLISLLRQGAENLPVLVAGHSMGGILALMIAAHPRSASTVTAVDACGVPLQFADEMQFALLNRTPPANLTHFPPPDPDHVRALFFGAEDTFATEALELAESLARPVPVAEMPDAANAPRDMPATLRKIRLPVRLTFADQEMSSIVNEAIVDEARANLSQSPRSLIRIEHLTGHNISLHHAGSQFHTGMLDWFEGACQA